jgi:hypothetical protein
MHFSKQSFGTNAIFCHFKTADNDQAWWLKLVILATWEVEIRRIGVQGQPRQKVCETPPSQPVTGPGEVHLSSELHREAQIRRSWSRLPKHKARLNRKNYYAKRAGRVA